MKPTATLALFLFASACSPTESESTQLVASDGGDPVGLLLQVKPGFNPQGVVYQKTAVVSVDGTPLPTVFEISQSSGPANGRIDVDGLDTGDTLVVSATFTDRTGAAPVTCEASYVAVAPHSLGCSPIEVFYQAVDCSCILVCN